jgi:hypothetical protein
VSHLSFRKALELVARNAEAVQEVPGPHQGEAVDSAIAADERGDPISPEIIFGVVIRKHSPREPGPSGAG